MCAKNALTMSGSHLENEFLHELEDKLEVISTIIITKFFNINVCLTLCVKCMNPFSFHDDPSHSIIL